MQDINEAACTHGSMASMPESCLTSFIQQLLRNVPKLHPAHMKIRYHVTYNVISLRRTDRLQSILQELDFCAVIAMQGTRNRQFNDLGMHSSVVNNFLLLQAGYGKRGNSHSGVALAINLKHVNRTCVHSFAYPQEPQIQGRALAVRVRQTHCDIMHISVYFPPASAHKAISVTKLLLGWLSSLFRKSPIRVIPVIYMDSNSYER